MLFCYFSSCHTFTNRGGRGSGREYKKNNLKIKVIDNWIVYVGGVKN